jgi:ADP-heptose:LPS heptosyltransferase
MTGQMKRRYPHKSNVLLVNITRLGDMLQATPTIAGLKMENPDCKVTVLVEKQFEGVCFCIPGIDDVVSIDLGMTVRSMTRGGDGIVDAYEYLDEIVQDLRSRNFDYCLNMSSSGYTAMLLNLIDVERRGGWTADNEGYRIIESEWARLFATSVFHQNRQFNTLNLVDVFRCSADVEQHPHKLMINTSEEDRKYCRTLLDGAGFTNTGPIIVIQAGASQGKRQWAPVNFVKLIEMLLERLNARVVLSGTKKELAIIDPIFRSCNSPNVLVAAGKTNIQQLAALLEMSDLLLTGDTGPMHMSVAVGTPLVSMFLASAFGFETGPYSEGNIILQPVIGCGPCNPNKSCMKPDCHDHISPELMADLAELRLKEDFRTIPEGLADPKRVIVYRSTFDKWGFCHLESLNGDGSDYYEAYREAYRKLWLDDIGGLVEQAPDLSSQSGGGLLAQVDGRLEGVDEVYQLAQKGERLIERLVSLIQNPSSPGAELGTVNAELSELDRNIEKIGYYYAHLGPVTRMFIFAKENLSGSDPVDLSSQMGGIYSDLARRCQKLVGYMKQSKSASGQNTESYQPQKNLEQGINFS